MYNAREEDIEAMRSWHFVVFKQLAGLHLKIHPAFPGRQYLLMQCANDKAHITQFPRCSRFFCNVVYVGEQTKSLLCLLP
jgi:hypothetical protein